MLWWCGLLVLLLLSNLGIGVWLCLDGGRGEPAAGAAQPAPVLHLLSERHGEAGVVASGAGEAADQPPPPAAASSATQAAGPAAAPGKSSLAAVGSGTAGAAPAGIDANAERPAVETPRNRDPSQLDPPASAATAGPGGSRTPYACVALGPFDTQADARQASVTWRELGVRQRIRREPATPARRWWVYLPAQSSREQAVAQARRLDARGIGDYFVLGKGGQKGTVSLGLFKDPGNAYKRRDALVRAGFAAQVAAQGEAGQAYWLDVAVADDGVPPGWREALRNHGIGLRVQARRGTAEGCF